MPPAVLTFQFDPFASIAGYAVRWQTIAIAVAILTGLILAARIAGVRGRGAGASGLRRDDLLYIVIGIVPGAILGGRFGYALLHLDYYADRPGLLLDPTQGDFELGLAILLGIVGGSFVAAMLSAPVRHWLHVSALPLLFVLGTGKLALVLSGAGQGLPSDLPWATRYVGDGPWLTLGPAIASHPSQAYEGIAILLITVALGAIAAAGGFGRRDGRLLAVALGSWALVRLAVAATWRDPVVAGPFRADQLISIALLVVAIVAWIALARRPVRDPDATLADAGPQWPDPPPWLVERGPGTGAGQRD